MRLLLIEDDEDIKFLYTSQLINHNLDVVNDCEKAFGLLEQNKYDLIVSDGELSTTSGYSFIRLYRIEDKTTPIILFTNSTGKNIELFCKIHDVVYVHKNFNTINDLENVIKMVKKTIGGKQ